MLTLILLNLNRIEFGKINLIDNRYGHLEEFLNSEISSVEVLQVNKLCTIDLCIKCHNIM